MAEELQLSLLGKLHINQNGAPVSGFVSGKAQALLCYLAVTGWSYNRETLAALLWGDLIDTKARANLRMALANLRRLLGPYLNIERDTISFNRNSPYMLDVELFQATLAEAGLHDSKTSGGDVLLQPLRQAVELYRGDFLEGFTVREARAFEEWQTVQRQRLRQQVVQALDRLVLELMKRGEFAAGLEYAGRLLALEPWREEAHRQLMLMLAKSGQRSAALAQYEICCRVLAEELGVEPSAETVALYERLKVTGVPRPHNLPPQTTPFIGRESELVQLAEYLGQPGYRLVTLVGLGGVGKTRLALQAAFGNLDLFRDGVFFVSLVAVTSSEAVIAHIAAALSLSMSGPVEPKVQLLNYLQTRELLLVLDNYEQLLLAAGGAELLVELLQAASGLKLLVTSRERLNLKEEWVLAVRGLEYPDRADERKFMANGLAGAMGDGTVLHAPVGYSAIALLLQHARRAQPDFTLSGTNLADVVRLCRLVQGMPLGLELSATWLPVLTPGEIAAEIERDLDFLVTSMRNVPERHRSMRAVIESSWYLLSEAERQALKRLSVFQGGFQREAALQVAGATLQLLLGLLNKSLLRRDATGRYDMHELIRQFAAEKLEQTPREQNDTEQRHGLYYAGFMARRDELLRSPRQLEVFREIEVDLGNIQAAWERAVDQGQVDLIDQYVWSLWLFFDSKTRSHQGYATFARAAERLEHVTRSCPLLYGRILAVIGCFCVRLTWFQEAKERLSQSLSLLEKLDAPREVALARQNLGLVAWGEGQYAEARWQLEESERLAREGGDEALAASSKSWLGCVAVSEGNYDKAERLFKASLQVLRRTDQSFRLANTLSFLGRTLVFLGQPAQAEIVLRESLEVSRASGDRWGAAFCLGQLGETLTLLGPERRMEAKRLQEESVTIFREIGNLWGLGVGLYFLGQTCSALDEADEAWRHFREALQIASRYQMTPLALGVLVNIAELWCQPGGYGPRPANSGTTLELLALILNHSMAEQQQKEKAALLVSQLQADLPRPLFETAMARGQARTLETVVAQILQHW